MPVDDLVLMSRFLSSKFRDLAREEGDQGFGYRYVIDLRDSPYQLPVKLYHDGFHDHINKIEFQGVARLGLSRTQEIAEEVLVFPQYSRIFRIDLCVDIWGISPWELAATSLFLHSQNYRVYRELGVTTFYPKFSKKTRIVRFYDRLARMRQLRDPCTALAKRGDSLTRVEVQLTASGVLHPNFRDIQEYADKDLLSDSVFPRLRAFLPPDLKPISRLAGEYLQLLANTVGLQAAAKTVSPSEWSYLRRKFFPQDPPGAFPSLNELLKKSTRDWLDDRIRFPRTDR